MMTHKTLKKRGRLLNHWSVSNVRYRRKELRETLKEKLKSIWREQKSELRKYRNEENSYFRDLETHENFVIDDKLIVNLI